MGKPRIIKKSHNVGFYKMEPYEAKCLEEKIQKMNENHEAITELSPAIYTEAKDGVLPQYNIRADKWELAQNAMDRVNRERIAKGLQMENPSKGETTQGGAQESAGQPS